MKVTIQGMVKLSHRPFLRVARDTSRSGRRDRKDSGREAGGWRTSNVDCVGLCKRAVPPSSWLKAISTPIAAFKGCGLHLTTPLVVILRL